MKTKRTSRVPSDGSWAVRLKRRLATLGRRTNRDFISANAKIVADLVANPDVGARMVVNIGADALIKFLATLKYMNIYDGPRIGGKKRAPSASRIKVDRLLGFGRQAARIYFGAVAMGGAGVRYYGNYCLVLRRKAVPPETRVFDRDSYDLLLPPLARSRRPAALVRKLRGVWERDLPAISVMKLFHLLENADRVRTTGNISDELLRDQEYIEIHKLGSFRPADISEVRLAPEDYAIDAHDRLTREVVRSPSTAAHLLWSARHRDVLSRLNEARIAVKVVSLHGRGYQWQ